MTDKEEIEALKKDIEKLKARVLVLEAWKTTHRCGASPFQPVRAIGKPLPEKGQPIIPTIHEEE